MRKSAKLLLALVVSAMSAISLSCQDDTPVSVSKPAVPTTAPATAGNPSLAAAPENRTAFQKSLLQNIEERKNAGLAVPADIAFEYNTISGTPLSTLKKQGIRPGQQYTVVAKTVVTMDGPQQAGLDRWPDFVVKGSGTPGAVGSVKEGDYTQQLRDYVEEKSPGVWERYEFGHEPRTYTFTEELTVTWPETSTQSPTTNASSTASDEFLFGFTFVGPNINNKIGGCVSVVLVDVGCFEAGYEFDYGLGLRLPMDVNVTSTEPMREGSTYSATSQTHGLNWSADDYTQAGVPPENGNELVLRLNFGAFVRVEVLGVDVFKEGIGPVREDKSESFTTPFGPGQFFSLPSIQVPVWDISLSAFSLELLLELTPQAGSEKFAADWKVAGNGPGKATGGGPELTFEDPTVPLTLSPVNALDGPGYAIVTLDDLRYYFDQFQLALGLCFKLEVFDYGVGTWCLDLPFSIDLDFITQNLYSGVHAGTPGSLNASFAIENVAPTAMIDLTGTELIHGVPTIMAHPGEVIPFVGRATDPGIDDITMTWDWDDGSPSPDVSTTYPVPFAVTESQSHAFGDACFYSVTLRSVDDDLDFGIDHLAVVITPPPGSTISRREGYWQHELAQVGRTDFTGEQLECFLGIVQHLSSVFGESRDISSLAQGYDVLFLKQNGGSLLEQLDRELLVAWLNFASGAYGYREFLDSNADGVGDIAFVDAMTTGEVTRMNSSASPADLKALIGLVHRLCRRNA